MLAYLTLVLLPGCGSEGGDAPENASCAPGTALACACPSGSVGLQTCNADGMSHGPCSCGVGAGGAMATTGGFAPASGGSPPGTGGTLPGEPGSGGVNAAGGLSGSGGTLGTGGTLATGGFGTGGADAGGAAGMDGSGGAGTIEGCEVSAVPDAIRSSYRLDPFYQKYADADGLPIATSQLVSDEAITLACQLVKEMVSRREDVRRALVDRGMRFTLIAASEELSSIPEVNARFGSSLNQRARGLGSLIPTICAEENILCQVSQDRWRGENICVHEYAHTIHSWGLAAVDPTFQSRLEAAYDAALASGNFRNTYAESSVGEFWAEGVQDWYNSNLESIPANGVHNAINTREELRQASPELYDLIAETFPEDIQFDDCYRVQ